MQNEHRLLALAVSVGLAFAAAGLGALATTPNIATWYADLAKPTWTPPSGIFGPVWTALYLAMAVSAWLVWTRVEPSRRRGPLSLYAVQLGLNALWSPVFFGWHRPDLALGLLVLLALVLVATVRSFLRVNRPAGLLLLPYLAWVGFATALNFEIWRLNPV